MQEGEKNPRLHLDSLKPAAIQFMLERLQESASQLGCLLPAFFMYLFHRNPGEWLIFKYPCET